MPAQLLMTARPTPLQRLFRTSSAFVDILLLPRLVLLHLQESLCTAQGLAHMDVHVNQSVVMRQHAKHDSTTKYGAVSW